MEIIAVLIPNIGNKTTCSILVADPYPATAYSPNNPTYAKTIVAAIEYPNMAIVIGID